ncbi:N-acetyltransferase [Paenibacillus baekrokdamisoli]|uniref:N-acetyltransferase n=1 Tax=Paenibacillus baekrokdamisoli TaxID=1712516 RepID=A0A3G9JAY9_9BACL|nr:GNAT family N-acetyltransferase [Paenibacillus baekrokdamisoli]MBB3070989.1 GNAT superfamily N-acetyltransferase [Paenibacillus baekrokdamisoli]BBH22073.1 N-acetyltransferase [Paenibacillus baekrokdamisoli]
MPAEITYGSKEESEYVRKRLIEYNYENVPDELKNIYEEINLTLKDDEGNIIGGLLSVLCWNWIEVDILWIDKTTRGTGLGTQLLNQIKDIAKQKKCTFIKLNTFSFQAPDFYIKNGYKEVAVFEDAPLGSKHYYFKKKVLT